MKLTPPTDEVDFARDLPVTPEDVAALRRIRGMPAPEGLDYLEFLQFFADTATEDLRKRRGPRGEPFRLPDS